MSNEVVYKKQKSIGFLGLLGLLFIGLKLGGQITWSWWLVLLPLYGPFCVIVLIFVAVAVLAVAVAKKSEGDRNNHWR